tara:strand:- start:27 stop:473 length:447 start_codon:yes stop_codon:yes gene_type:complete
MQQNVDPQKAQEKVLWFIWGGFLFSQPLFASTLILTLQGKGEFAAHADLGILTIGLSLAAGMSGLASYFIPNIILKSTKENPKMPTAQRHFVPYILKWTFSESVGLFGFVLGFKGVAVEVWSIFFAAAVLLLLFHRPRMHSDVSGINT